MRSVNMVSLVIEKILFSSSLWFTVPYAADITLTIIHLGTSYSDIITEINKFSVELKKLKEMSFYRYGWASYSIPVVQHI